MIRAKCNITGTITKEAVVRTDKNHKSYLSFILTVKLPDPKLTQKEINIFVAMYNGQQSDLFVLTVGKQIVVSGELDIHNREDYSFYLNAEKYEMSAKPSLDSINGTLTFRGRLKNENIYEEKKDSKGNPFLVFSAYSSEKYEDKFYSIWVNFLRFPGKDETIDAIISNFMKPKAIVSIIGNLNISAFGGTLHFSSIVKEISEYKKTENQQ